MRIGIGIITKNKPTIVKKCYDQHIKFKHPNADVIIFNDYSYEAKTRSEVLRSFEDYDYIILTQSNIIPKNPEWVDQFIKAHEENPDQHAFSCININNTGTSITNHCTLSTVMPENFIFLTKFALSVVKDINADLWEGALSRVGAIPLGMFNATIGNISGYLDIDSC